MIWELFRAVIPNVQSAMRTNKCCCHGNIRITCIIASHYHMYWVSLAAIFSDITELAPAMV